MSFEPDDISHEQAVEIELDNIRLTLEQILNVLKLIANLDPEESLED